MAGLLLQIRVYFGLKCSDCQEEHAWTAGTQEAVAGALHGAACWSSQADAGGPQEIVLLFPNQKDLVISPVQDLT